MQSDLEILCSLTYTTVTIDSISGQRRPRSACATAQANQGLRCPKTALGPFSCVSRVIRVFCFKLKLMRRHVHFLNSYDSRVPGTPRSLARTLATGPVDSSWPGHEQWRLRSVAGRIQTDRCRCLTDRTRHNVGFEIVRQIQSNKFNDLYWPRLFCWVLQ